MLDLATLVVALLVPLGTALVARRPASVRRRPRPVAAAPVGDRVLVVTGSYGAGHDSAAREIGLRITAAGVAAPVVDVVGMFPAGLGALLRRAYFAQLEVLPGSWAWVLRLLEQRHGVSGWLARSMTRGLGRLVARGLLTHVDARTVCVVSTHPFASQALGELRRSGRLGVPAITYLTDASVHDMWVHEDVDLHVAVHQQAVDQARSLGAANTVLIEPLTPSVRIVEDTRTIRRDLGIPTDGPVALVVGGSEGVGDLARTAREIRDSAVAVPVVVCGRNDALRSALDAERGIVALGWLDGLSRVIAASDCVVQNSGGFTTLETLALGVPLISYRCLPGHGQENARALESEGMAPWPRVPGALVVAITEALSRPSATAASTWSVRPRLLEVLPIATVMA